MSQVSEPVTGGATHAFSVGKYAFLFARVRTEHGQIPKQGTEPPGDRYQSMVRMPGALACTWDAKLNQRLRVLVCCTPVTVLQGLPLAMPSGLVLCLYVRPCGS